jgi:site-specific recombinase XerD
MMETKVQMAAPKICGVTDDLSARLALPAGLEALPGWFSEPLGQFLRSKQRNWPAKTVQRSTRQLYGRMRYMGEFFMREYGWQAWADLSARWTDDFIDQGVRRGLSPATINWDLIHFCQFCNFLAEGGEEIPKAILRVKKLDIPKRLPRPLPGNDVFVLEKCILDALSGERRWQRDIKAIRDLAWFYLLWHCGLRVSEVCGLMVQDVDLDNGKLFVSNSKERKDRVIYVSKAARDALRAHFDFSSDRAMKYVFENDGHPLSSRAIQRSLNLYGRRCGIHVSPHRLRHTFASQMLNAGMPVTSLQRYLGHEELDTTMNYAKVSDPVLQKEYSQAIRGMDPLWQLDEYAAKLQIAQQRLQTLTTSLDQAKQNAGCYLGALEEIQGLIDELRKDVS